MKENPPTSPNLGGTNNVAPKDKPSSSFSSFLTFFLAGTVKVGGRVSNTNPISIFYPDPASVPLWEFCPSPLDGAAAAPRLFHPSTIFHLKYCVWWSYFHFIDMLITDSIWTTLLSDLTTCFTSISLTFQLEQTFVELSILTESRLSK